MVLPTPEELVKRLKRVYRVETDEELARKLNVPVRAVGRWKTSRGMSYNRTLDFLNRAGWLAVTEKMPTAQHLETVERAAAEAAELGRLAAAKEQSRARRARPSSK